jgi:hypothetical protein
VSWFAKHYFPFVVAICEMVWEMMRTNRNSLEARVIGTLSYEAT